MYPITQFIAKQLSERSWSKSQLISAMGYKNISRGLQRLDTCLQQGNCTNADMLARLFRALAPPREEFDAAIAETRRQLAEEERVRLEREEEVNRAHFRPYVYVRTSQNRPPFITAAAVIGPQLKYLQLDEELVVLPRTLLLARVAQIVRQHYHLNFGKCLLFGDITGYALRITYGETVEFTSEGILVGIQAGWTEDEGHSMMQIGNSAIREGLFSLTMSLGTR